jgi:hypothetical protein
MAAPTLSNFVRVCELLVATVLSVAISIMVLFLIGGVSP